MHFVRIRPVESLTAAVNDFRFVFIPIIKDSFGSAVTVVDVDFRFFFYGYAVHQRTVEHAVEFA